VDLAEKNGLCPAGLLMIGNAVEFVVGIFLVVMTVTELSSSAVQPLSTYRTVSGVDVDL